MTINRYALAGGLLFGAVFSRVVVMLGAGSMPWWPTATGVALAALVLLWPGPPPKRPDWGRTDG